MERVTSFSRQVMKYQHDLLISQFIIGITCVMFANKLCQLPTQCSAIMILLLYYHIKPKIYTQPIYIYIYIYIYITRYYWT
jgi:hypothetical protein